VPMNHLRQIKRQTSGLLAELGNSPDEVAETLASNGVHGVPRDNHSCAVARYVSAVVGSEPSIRSVAVGPCSMMISLVRPGDNRPAGRLHVQLPKPVRDFVAAFDARQYPMVTQEASSEPPVSAPIRH
jgi:hypothetical protein